MEKSLTDHSSLILILMAFSIIAVAGTHIAKLFIRVKLPVVTGLLLIGVICGPFVLKMIPIGSHHQIFFLRDICISFIAFSAGCELYLKELRNRFNSIKWMTLSQLFIIFLLGVVLVFLIADYIPYMKDQSVFIKVAIAMLTATIFVTRSPASAIAVINELRAKGRFTQTILGTTIVMDFIVILLFGLVLALSETLIHQTHFNIISVLFILLELLLSFILGYLLFLLIRYLLKININRRTKIFLLILITLLIYQVSHWVKDYSHAILDHDILIEPLLICIIGSFLVTNYSKYRSEFILMIEEISPVIYIVFFTYIGISLEIDIFLQIWPVALVFFLIRLIPIIISSALAVRLANDPSKFYRVAWMPYLSQGPVALGLTTIVADQFPAWGAEFLTIVIGLIVINHLLGDPLLKFSIRYVGEDRSKGNLYEYDGIRDALIFGMESQSIALSRQLLHNGWKARIITLEPPLTAPPIEGIEVIQMEEVTGEKLDEINADKTEAFILLLTDEENYEICELAYQRYGTKVMVVRLNERGNFEKFHKLGALIVEPSTAIVSLLDHFVRSPQATSLLLGMQPDQDTRDIEVMNPNLHGIYLRDLRLPADIIVLSVKRGGQMIISHGYTRLRLGDVVTLVGTIESLDKVALRFE